MQLQNTSPPPHLQGGEWTENTWLFGERSGPKTLGLRRCPHLSDSVYKSKVYLDVIEDLLAPFSANPQELLFNIVKYLMTDLFSFS